MTHDEAAPGSSPESGDKLTLGWFKFWRGGSWIVLAIVGALLIGPHLTEWGITDYSQRWFGACLKAATGAWGGFRITRGLLRMDPSKCKTELGFAIMHAGRAILVGLVILAICLAV